MLSGHVTGHLFITGGRKPAWTTLPSKWKKWFVMGCCRFCPRMCGGGIGAPCSLSCLSGWLSLTTRCRSPSEVRQVGQEVSCSSQERRQELQTKTSELGNKKVFYAQLYIGMCKTFISSTQISLLNNHAWHTSKGLNMYCQIILWFLHVTHRILYHWKISLTL